MLLQNYKNMSKSKTLESNHSHPFHFTMSNQVQPYTIAVPVADLQDLKQRLHLAKSASQLESPEQDSWEFGVPTSEVQRLVKYWKDGFDWRKAESHLNELPQFHTDIEVDGFGVLDIHCE